MKDLTTEELNDLLIHKTLRLLDLLADRKIHGMEYRDVKLEVECIQHSMPKKRHGKK